MFLKFDNHINSNFSFLKEKRLLLAISGGLDSMTMVQLFQKLNYNITLAHCNFQLRGLESAEDQNFVHNYAAKNSLPIFTKQFDTENFAKDNKLSIQVAARKLRYDWFYELLKTEKFNYILTAHQADDNLETFLINLSRGTGLDGLTGIPKKNNQIIRPLLPFSRQEIKSYAEENNLKWREDSSNASNKYLRNKIRHDLVPILKELNTSFLNTFQQTQIHLQEVLTMVEDAGSIIYKEVTEQKNNAIYFDLITLKKLSNYKSYLYFWLKDYNFSAWEDIYNLVEAQTGKIVYSDEYLLLKNRNHLILSKIQESENEIHLIHKNEQEVKIPINLSLLKVKKIAANDANYIFVDETLMNFPLFIRKYNNGDIFYPEGMQGKKLLSKYFKDEKMSMLDKENTWLLCSKEDIVWVINKRADKRFKATSTTKNILKITML